jgi:hypothetical protein
VKVCSMPCSRYQAIAWATPSGIDTLVFQAKSASVREGSSRIDSASSAARGRISTSISPRSSAAVVASNSSLIETSEPEETW